MIALIDRKHIRDLWAIRGRIVALCLIIASGIGMLLGVGLALADLRTTQDRFLDGMGFADLEIAITPTDTHNLPVFAAHPGIAAQDQRLVFPATIVREHEAVPLAGLIMFQQDATQRINRYRIVEGRQFRPGAHEVVIDRSLAAYHGYHVGDRLRMKVGSIVYDERIAGVALSPEFIVSTASPDYVVAKPGSLGVAWTDIGQVSDALGFTMVNSLLFRFTPDAAGAAARAAVLHAAAGLDVQKITPRAESYSVKMVAMNLTAFGIYSPAIVWTLCALSFAMGIITFRRFGIEKQSDFAILLSIGVTRRAIALSLIRIGAVIGLIGGIAGFGIALLLGRGFATVYAAAMHLPSVDHYVALGSFVAALALGGLCGMLSIVLAIVPMLRHTPRHLLQFRGPEGGGYAPRWLDRLPLAVRYSLRSLLRDRARTFAAVVAMACSIGVAISYGIAMTSTLQTVDENFAVERWTHAVDFQYPVYQDEGEAALGVLARRAEPYLRGSVVIRSRGAQQIAQMVGIRIGGRLRHQITRDGRAIAAPGDVVISADLARDLGVGLGAVIRLEKNTGSLDGRIVGITNDQYLQTVTIPIGDAQTLAQADQKISGAFLVATPAAGQALAARDIVARVTEKADLLAFFSREMASKMGIVHIAILFSVGTSILFVSTLVYLGILESRGDYAVLRSLGFTLRQITTIILVGVTVLIGLAAVIGIPLALVIATLLNMRMAEAWLAVRLYAGLGDFLWPILAILPVAPFVGWLGARTVMALNIPVFLRERSI